MDPPGQYLRLVYLFIFQKKDVTLDYSLSLGSAVGVLAYFYIYRFSLNIIGDNRAATHFVIP